MEKKSEAIELWNRNELSNAALIETFEADVCARLSFKNGEMSDSVKEEFRAWLSGMRRRGYSFADSRDFLIEIVKHYHFYAHLRKRAVNRWRYGQPDRRRSPTQRAAYKNLMALERLERLDQLDTPGVAESIRGLVPFSSLAFDPGLTDLDLPSRQLITALSDLTESNPEAARFAVLRLFAGQTLDEIASRTGHSVDETYKTWLDVQRSLNQSGVQTEAGVWLPVASDDILRVISEDPRLLQQVSWREFERIMADLLARLGFQIELQQGTKDGGIDILALRGGAFGDHRYLIQAKRWTNKVGVEPVPGSYYFYRATIGRPKAVWRLRVPSHEVPELAAEYRWQLDLKDLRGIQAWVAEAIRGST